MPHAALAPGRTAVITGGASGIGLATAKRLAAAGLHVCIADIDDDALEAASERLSKLAPGGKDSVLWITRC